MIFPILTLAFVGAAEAIVYQKRYAATHGKPLDIAVWTQGVCTLRVAFVGAVSQAAGEMPLAVAVLAYGIPAAAVTWLVRAREITKEKR